MLSLYLGAHTLLLTRTIEWTCGLRQVLVYHEDLSGRQEHERAGNQHGNFGEQGKFPIRYTFENVNLQSITYVPIHCH